MFHIQMDRVVIVRQQTEEIIITFENGFCRAVGIDISD